MRIDTIERINIEKHILKVTNGHTRSSGVGMADMGGYPEIKFDLIDKDLVYTEMSEGSSSKYYNIKEIDEPNLEYILYLRLKSKFEK